MDVGSWSFQSPDGDFVYSDLLAVVGVTLFLAISFNPLTGISSILTLLSEPMWVGWSASFNPLTGISSILTSASL